MCPAANFLARTSGASAATLSLAASCCSTIAPLLKTSNRAICVVLCARAEMLLKRRQLEFVLREQVPAQRQRVPQRRARRRGRSTPRRRASERGETAPSLRARSAPFISASHSVSMSTTLVKLRSSASRNCATTRAVSSAVAPSYTDCRARRACRPVVGGVGLRTSCFTVGVRAIGPAPPAGARAPARSAPERSARLSSLYSIEPVPSASNESNNASDCSSGTRSRASGARRNSLRVTAPDQSCPTP